MPKKIDKVIKLDKFVIVNAEKYDRAILGAMGSGGELKGGVGEDASDVHKLAAYDRLGGLIKKDGHKVKTGCFWNFASKIRQFEVAGVIKEPVVLLEFNDLDGNKVYIEDGAPISKELEAAKLIAEKKAKKAVELQAEKEEKAAKIAEKKKKAKEENEKA